MIVKNEIKETSPETKLETFKQSKNNYIIVFGILFVLELILLKFVAPYVQQNFPPPFHKSMIVYFIIVYVLVFRFTNLWKNNHDEICRLKEEQCKIFRIGKILVVLIFSILLFFRVYIIYAARDYMDIPFILAEYIPQVLLYLLSGFGEEFLYSGLLYEGLKQKKVPFMLNILIVSLIFAFSHLQFNAIFLGTFLFRIVVMIGFRFYPSLVFFGIFHTLYNVLFYSLSFL